jgi:two-component system, sensor histidine kinase and response regulator
MGNNPQEIIPLIREIELFTNFDDNVLAILAQNMKEITVKKDETLFAKGDQENSLFIVIDGSLKVHNNDYTFTILNNKQFFGEYALIDSAQRSASVTAVSDSVLLKLSQAVFNQVMETRPELWKSVLMSLTKRLRDFNVLEERLTLKTIEIQKRKAELVKEKENLENQKKDLEISNASKDKFFTIIAHDLKNPFSTIINISDLMLSDLYKSEPAKNQEYIEQINRYSRKAFNLLENLLQWARSQTGHIKINFKKVSLDYIFNDVIELLSGIAQHKNIDIIIKGNTNIDVYVDQDMVTAIFRNLLSNALKFSPNESEITVNTIETGDMVRIEVTDQGIGMDDKQLENLFRIDARSLNYSQDGEMEGTGLGLVLCKEFVTKHGGEIWATSLKENGSTFTFTVPKAL